MGLGSCPSLYFRGNSPQAPHIPADEPPLPGWGRGTPTAGPSGTGSEWRALSAAGSSRRTGAQDQGPQGEGGCVAGAIFLVSMTSALDVSF